jgi:hypothetical protein
MKTNVLVSIDDQHLAEMPSVVERLRNAGLEVQRSLSSLGTVTGSIEHTRIPQVREVEGVAGVEAAREVGIAPPDSDIQ